MANKIRYKIVGICVDENKEVTGYILLDSTGKQQKYTRSQVYFLAGSKQLVNADGHLEQDKVILTGINCDLSKLPVRQEMA